MMTITRDRLRALHLSAMADAYVSQYQDASTSALGFDERFSMLVDAEHLFRDNRALARRLKEAKLRMPQACLEDLDCVRESVSPSIHACRHAGIVLPPKPGLAGTRRRIRSKGGAGNGRGEANMHPGPFPYLYRRGQVRTCFRHARPDLH